MDISKVLNTREFAAYWRELPPLTYFGESKFEYRKQLGSEIKYIMGAEQRPVIMSLTSNDADSIGLSYGGLEVVTEKMPRFKNHYTIDEDLIKMLLSVDENASGLIRETVAKIFDRVGMHRKNAAITRELLRMQALTTGVASMKNNGVEFTVDYHVPTTHKVQPTVMWDTVATADPVQDIEDWQQLALDDNGSPVTEILMNSATLGKLRKIETIRTGYFANSNAVGNPTSRQVAQYLTDSLGVRILLDDDTYLDLDGKTKKMVPDGTVVLMPEGNLGYSVFGTTPEEARLRDGVEVVDGGVALTYWEKRDPVADMLKATQDFLPSFERANEVIIATVLTA